MNNGVLKENQMNKTFMLENSRKGLIILLLIAAASFASCASTGQFMPLSKGETVIGTAQASFMVYSSSLFMTKGTRDAINTQAYIKLLEAAKKIYSGNVDIRDIIWTTGGAVVGEYSATGKVIQAYSVN
jgi:hypothetical protein